MRNATPAAPQSAPTGPRPGAMPDTQSLLEEIGALYPVVAFWDVESPGPDDELAEGKLDEDALDEVIFAGMVALR